MMTNYNMRLAKTLLAITFLGCIGCEVKPSVGPVLQRPPFAALENEGIHYHYYTLLSPHDVVEAWPQGADAILDDESEKTMTAVIVVPVEKVKVDTHPVHFTTKFEDKDGRQIVQPWIAEEREGREFYVAVSLLPNGFVKASTTIRSVED